MLKKTLATGVVALASAGVLLAAPAAAHAGTWTHDHGSDVSGNLAYINGVENENQGCGNGNAVLGQTQSSCFNTGVIIQD